MTSLLRSIFSIFSGRIAGIILGVIYTPLLVRVLTQNQYGVFATVLAAFSVASLIVQGGLFDAIRKTVAEYPADSGKGETVISTSLLLALIYGLIGVLVAVLVLITGFIPQRYVPYVLLLIPVLIAGNILAAARGSLFGFQREDLGELIGVLQQAFYFTTALILAYYGYDVVGVFVGYALSFIMFAIAGVVLLRQYSSITLPNREDISTYSQDLAKYGGIQLIGGVSAMLLYKTDILLVQFFTNQSSTALYQSAIIPAEMIWFGPSIIQLAFLQRTSKLWSQEKIETINHNIQSGIKYSVLSLTLFGVGLFVLAEPFLRLYYGPKYIAASGTLRILICGTFLFGISRVITPVLQATGWVRYTEGVTLCALIVNVCLNGFLIPRYGFFGAGVGTAISYVLILVGNSIIWYRSPFSMVSVPWIIRLIAVQTIFAVGFFSLAGTISLPPILSLIVLPIVGGITFLVINAAAGYLSPAELRAVATTVK